MRSWAIKHPYLPTIILSVNIGLLAFNAGNYIAACGGGGNDNKADYGIYYDFITPIGIEVQNCTDRPVDPLEIDWHFRDIEAGLGVCCTEQIDNWYLGITFVQAEPCPWPENCWGFWCGNDLSRNAYCGGIYDTYFEGYPKITLAWNAPGMTLENSCLRHELGRHMRHMHGMEDWDDMDVPWRCGETRI